MVEKNNIQIKYQKKPKHVDSWGLTLVGSSK